MALVVDSGKILNKKDFARAIRVAPQRISGLVAAGLPVRADGLIDSGVGRKWYLDRKRTIKKGRPPNPKPKMTPDAESNGNGDGAEELLLPFDDGEAADYAKARAEKEVAQAGITNLQWKRLQGDLLERVAVERVASDVGRQIRDAVMSVPDRLAPILAAQSSAAAIHRELTEELERALVVAADTIRLR